MIDVTRRYCGVGTLADGLRYGERRKGSPHAAPPSAAERKPVVVYNCTRRCNLRCVHCYSDSADRAYEGELSTAEALEMIRGLAAFGVPALLFSGGEPLLRRDLFELAAGARELGLRTVLSTNGTLIDGGAAGRLKAAGFSYIGVSLDGTTRANDRFRGRRGAFAAALSGMRSCLEAGLRVGLRFTLTRRNADELDRVFDLAEREGLHRICVYHLVAAGRGRSLFDEDLPAAEKRSCVDRVLARAADLAGRGSGIDVLTVDQHADGVYIYRRLLGEDPARAEEVRGLLAWNGGGRYSSGVGIACVDARGDVRPDQFWPGPPLGSVRERPFAEIWSDPTEPLLAALRDRLKLLKGRCGACRHLELCGGSFRSRALIVHGDPWAEDPGCYLTDEEIGLTRRAAPDGSRVTAGGIGDGRGRGN